mmetsp:Transcript_11313/g.42406  ORF Transcript_11313/g.42406 Transcript_11313/m.42406 type:complete len:537 (-) Transcript_11313:107-1717(-)
MSSSTPTSHPSPLDTTIHHNATNSATTPNGSNNDESISSLAFGKNEQHAPSQKGQLSVNTASGNAIRAFNSTETPPPTMPEDHMSSTNEKDSSTRAQRCPTLQDDHSNMHSDQDDDVEMRDISESAHKQTTITTPHRQSLSPSGTIPAPSQLHQMNVHIVGRLAPAQNQHSYTFHHQNAQVLPPTSSYYSSMHPQSVVLPTHYFHNPHAFSTTLPTTHSSILDKDARYFLEQDHISTCTSSQSNQHIDPPSRDFQSTLSEWLILETQVVKRLSSQDNWKALLNMLNVSEKRFCSKYHDKGFVQQIVSDWQQLTTMYFLATRRIKVRFQNRSIPFGPYDPQGEAETKEFIVSYKRAQLNLLSKAENHLRQTLQHIFENAQHDVSQDSESSTKNYGTIQKMEDLTEDDTELAVKTEDQKSTAKVKNPDISLPLVLHLQEFIKKNITFPYMRESEITSVSNEYLLDKQRVKRKLQNMRTRLWKPFVIEKGLVNASYFKAGNQLKKFLSTSAKDFKAGNWQELFQEWIGEKKRSNWTYNS